MSLVIRMHFGLGTRLILYFLHYQTPCSYKVVFPELPLTQELLVHQLSDIKVIELHRKLGQSIVGFGSSRSSRNSWLVRYQSQPGVQLCLELVSSATPYVSDVT